MDSTSVTKHGLPAITDYLDAHGIAYEVVEHAETTSASADARATGFDPDATVKTVVLQEGGAYVLALIPSSRRLQLRSLRDVLGASRRSLQLADEAQIARDFPMFDVGAIPPLGPMMPMAEFLDTRLLEHERVLCAGGDHLHGLLLDPREIVRVSDARVLDISEEAWRG
jgi:prolyl-tRNA editing enzyme YbaK/EbsC (Cys-tRNA(Pro) deacylase)